MLLELGPLFHALEPRIYATDVSVCFATLLDDLIVEVVCSRGMQAHVKRSIRAPAQEQPTGRLWGNPVTGI